MFTSGVCSFQVYSAEARHQNFGMSMLERLHQYYFNFYHQLQSRPQSTPLNIFLSINYHTQVQSLSVFSSSSSASTTARRYSHCQYSKHLPQHYLPHKGTVSALNIFLSIIYHTKVQSVLSTSSSASTITHRYSHCQYSHHLPWHQLPHKGRVTAPSIFLSIIYRTKIQSSQHLPQHRLWCTAQW